MVPVAVRAYRIGNGLDGRVNGVDLVVTRGLAAAVVALARIQEQVIGRLRVLQVGPRR